MRKIAIIGARGFIGSHLVDHFSESDHVVAFHRKKCAENRHDTIHQESIYWDITEPYTWAYDTIDICIHTAASIDYTGDWKDAHRANVESITNVIDWAVHNRCRHLIYISSSSVYMGISGVIGEDISIQEASLANPYALTKYQAEQRLLNELPLYIKLTILRPRAVYGTGDITLLPTILSHQLYKHLILPGDGQTHTSLTSIASLIEAIDLTLEFQISQQAVYNVCDPHIWSYEEIYHQISRAYHLKGIIHIPRWLMHTLAQISPKKWKYLSDAFLSEKILDTQKIQAIGFQGVNDFERHLAACNQVV